MRYKVDLKRFMAECETNYYRLSRLFPALAGSDEQRLGLPGEGEAVMSFQVLERSRYTTLMEITQQHRGQGEWLPQPCLRVRMYHDARMAEVVSCAGVRRVEPRYPYPNKRMHQPDEKAQWNRFLADWLALGIEHGRALSIPCEFTG